MLRRHVAEDGEASAGCVGDRCKPRQQLHGVFEEGVVRMGIMDMETNVEGDHVRSSSVDDSTEPVVVRLRNMCVDW
jgi:hypothetical protein